VKLSDSQLKDLLAAHCYRVINNMNHNDLMGYAIQMMIGSFDVNPGQGDTDQTMLIEDILTAEGEDDDAAVEFITGVGIDPDTAQALIDQLG
jgi:hypothetical protein